VQQGIFRIQVESSKEEKGEAFMDLKALRQEAERLQDQIVKWRRDLHQIPEIGLDLPLTSAYVEQALRDMGIPVKTKVGKSGVVGLIEGGEPGPTFALRADMDALPVQEETGLPFASRHPGRMHACGHDTHMAMLLGAAKLILAHRSELKGNVKLIFQPAEEGPGGAEPMIRDGVLTDPPVDAILGLHIGSIFKEVPPGAIGVGYGPLMASLDRFYIKVIGKGGHGAMPETTVDPVAITATLIGALQQLVSREQKPTHPLVLTIGRIQGGTAYNVIPSFVELEGTVRATREDERQNIARRMEQVVAGITQAMRGSYEFKYDFGYPPLITDEAVTRHVEQTARELFGPEGVITLSEPTMGGEDMAFFLERVPGSFIFLGGANPAKGIVRAHHSPTFDVDEDVFWRGSAVLAASALTWPGRRE
jgi:amidohydrolase